MAITASRRNWRWPFPEKLQRSWRAISAPLSFSFLVFTKLMMRLTLQRVQTKNLRVLEKAALHRPPGVSLITVSNHSSCVDDPVLWESLPLYSALYRKTTRWIPTAQEVCFKNTALSFVFSRVQSVPVVRGDGVHQRGMSYCIKLLNDGDWVHIFPEGKINLRGDKMRLKWGVGHLAAETEHLPIVIPLWHVGMDDILPNKSPYIPQFFKKLTVLVGDPIDFSTVLKRHHTVGSSAVVIRRNITDIIQEKLYDLRAQAEALHDSWDTRIPCKRRLL